MANKMGTDNDAEIFGAPLTAKEIDWMTEISLDRAANERMLMVATNSFRNLETEITKRNNDMWKELAETRGIDLQSGSFTVKNVRGAMSIVKMTAEDEFERVLDAVRPKEV